MSFLLWTDEANDEAIDLGNPFTVFSAFAEMARAAPGEDADFGELYYVPQMGEQAAPPEWLGRVRQQAKLLLTRHGDNLGEAAQWILGQLMGRPAEAVESIQQPPPAPSLGIATVEDFERDEFGLLKKIVRRSVLDPVSILEACVPNKAGPGCHDTDTGHPCPCPDGDGKGEPESGKSETVKPTGELLSGLEKLAADLGKGLVGKPPEELVAAKADLNARLDKLGIDNLSKADARKLAHEMGMMTTSAMSVGKVRGMIRGSVLGRLTDYIGAQF